MSEPPAQLALGADLAAHWGLGEWLAPPQVREGANSLICAFQTRAGRFCAKGRDPAERPVEALLAEHRLIAHLVAKGFPTPAVLPDPQGQTFVPLAGRLWSVYRHADGDDRYRDASVFEPFNTLAEARSAGSLLGRFHQAAADFAWPQNVSDKGLSARFDLAWQADLHEALRAAFYERPQVLALLSSLEGWPSAIERLDRLRLGLPGTPAGGFDRSALPSGLIHGDWIKRNLFFVGDEVSAVLDFDLACHAPLAYDLALAISAAAYPWAHLAAGGAPYRDHAEAMLAGYESARPLRAIERKALVALLATCRFEFHLRLVALLQRRGQSGRALWVWHGQQAYLSWWEAAITKGETL